MTGWTAIGTKSAADKWIDFGDWNDEIKGNLEHLYGRTSAVRVAKAAADSPYTVPSAGYHVDVDCTAGAVTVVLPAAATAGAGAVIQVRKTDASANAVTIDGNGAETINGAATLIVYSQYDCYTLMSDGTGWGIV